MKENLTIGFIGNLNCGKTTLFNAYTGVNLKVANWLGVTVERVEGVIKDYASGRFSQHLQPDFLYNGRVGVQTVYIKR